MEEDGEPNFIGKKAAEAEVEKSRKRRYGDVSIVLRHLIPA